MEVLFVLIFSKIIIQNHCHCTASLIRHLFRDRVQTYKLSPNIFFESWVMNWVISIILIVFFVDLLAIGVKYKFLENIKCSDIISIIENSDNEFLIETIYLK